jgi:hypothetical protein
MDRKKCPGGKCEKCYLFRRFTYEEEAEDPETKQMMKTGQIKHFWRCAIDHLLEATPKIFGSIDGVQRATNETRNRVEAFGQAVILSLAQIDKKQKLLGKK